MQALSTHSCGASSGFDDLRNAALACVPLAMLLLVRQTIVEGVEIDSLWRLFVFIVLAPALEEVIFRAGLQAWLAQHLTQRSGRWLPARAGFGANLLTAIAFAAVHLLVQSDHGSALTAIPSLALGWLFQRTQRVLPCIALHSIFNALWIMALGSLR